MNEKIWGETVKKGREYSKTQDYEKKKKNVICYI